MTEDRDFKRRVRERAEATGEPYVLARRRLQADAPPPQGSAEPGAPAGWQVVRTELGALDAFQRGASGPTVVFEAGLAIPTGHVWDDIAHSYVPRCSVVTYDRAGHGRSLDGAAPRGPLTIAAELAALLDVLDPPRPWIVVTCDRASAYGVNLAIARPEVEAVVLVEPTWPPPTTDVPQTLGVGLWVGPWLETRAISWLRHWVPAARRHTGSRLSEDASAAVIDALYDDRSQATSRLEADGFRAEPLFAAGAASRLRDLRVSVVGSPTSDGWRTMARSSSGDFIALHEPCSAPVECASEIELALGHAIDAIARR